MLKKMTLIVNEVTPNFVPKFTLRTIDGHLHTITFGHYDIESGPNHKRIILTCPDGTFKPWTLDNFVTHFNLKGFRDISFTTDKYYVSLLDTIVDRINRGISNAS